MNTILQLLRQNEIVVVEQVCGLAYSPAFTIINENMLISFPKSVRHRSVTGSYRKINRESMDMTFLSVNISVTTRDNKPSNYMLLLVLWSGS